MHGDEFPDIPTDGDPAGSARIVSIVKTQTLLGDITRREVTNMIRRGELETCKVGRRRMVVLDSINTYIDDRIEASRMSVAA